MQPTNLDFSLFKQRDFSNKLNYKTEVIFPDNDNMTLPVYAFQIERDIDYIAQSCQLELHNINPSDIQDPGYYSPDREGTWNQILWPGKKLQVKVTVQVFDKDVVTNTPTYKEETFVLFTGYIDDVSMVIEGSKSAIKIYARDSGNLLMDNKIPVDEFGDRWLEYSEVDISDIVHDLLLKSGLIEDDIGYIQPTGIMIDIEFYDCSFADCIAQLQDICNFDFYFNEEGKAYWIESYATGPIAEVMTSFPNSETYKYLGFENDHYSTIIPNSETVISLDGSTKYEKDTDYTIDYRKKVISRTENSNIPLNTNIKVTFIHTAYHFKAGEDIYSLTYKISRQSVYGSIKVVGDGEEAIYNNPNPTYYGVSVEKIQILSENLYLTTEEQCQEMANRLGNGMLRTFRHAEILGVGIPFLQFGDCVQITENITTASEIYRICGLKFSMQNGMLYTTARTYYYDHSPT